MVRYQSRRSPSVRNRGAAIAVLTRASPETIWSNSARTHSASVQMMSANSALVSVAWLVSATAITSIPVFADCRGAGGFGTSTPRDVDHLMHILYT